MTNDEEILRQFPKPGKQQPFSLLKIDDVAVPHPYCITPKHLELADSMYLNEATIARAEARGAQCDICKQRVLAGHQSGILSYREHTVHKTLFIAVDDPHDLNGVEGLHAYLVRIKPQAESLGIEEFAFPAREQSSSCV